MKSWRLCAPTYGRANPLILKMLDKDSRLDLYLCCRHEEIEKGVYEHLRSNERIHIVDLGVGLHELGETRQRIMQYCKDENVKFCCMFDDGIFDVNDSNIQSFNISDIFDECIDFMTSDPMSDQVIGFSFHKRIGQYKDGRLCHWDSSKLVDANYFLTFPAQAVILNVEKAFEYGIEYKSLDEVGFEDCAFFADAVKEKLVYCARKNITIDGVVPNEKKIGGSHSASEDLEKKYDIQNARCLAYIGNMMGVSVEKRYRSYAECCLGYIIWNTDFFREVLCDKPELNKKIIEAKFIREY